MLTLYTLINWYTVVLGHAGVIGEGFFLGGGGLFRAQNSLFSCAQLYHLVHKAYHQDLYIYILTSKVPDKFSVHKELILII